MVCTACTIAFKMEFVSVAACVLDDPDKPPFIGGTWEVTYTFNEIRADVALVSNSNPCQGPFPYKLRKKIDLHQVEGKGEIFWCVKGENCETKGVKGQLTPASVDVTQTKCEVPTLLVSILSCNFML